MARLSCECVARFLLLWLDLLPPELTVNPSGFTLEMERQKSRQLFAQKMARRPVGHRRGIHAPAQRARMWIFLGGHATLRVVLRPQMKLLRTDSAAATSPSRQSRAMVRGHTASQWSRRNATRRLAAARLPCRRSGKDSTTPSCTNPTASSCPTLIGSPG